MPKTDTKLGNTPTEDASTGLLHAIDVATDGILELAHHTKMTEGQWQQLCTHIETIWDSAQDMAHVTGHARCHIPDRRHSVPDGTTGLEMIADWLAFHGYDGLCNPDAECGCDSNDLAPCGCASNLSGCVCAYLGKDDDGEDRFFTSADDAQLSTQPSCPIGYTEQSAKPSYTVYEKLSTARHLVLGHDEYIGYCGNCNRELYRRNAFSIGHIPNYCPNCGVSLKERQTWQTR